MKKHVWVIDYFKRQLMKNGEINKADRILHGAFFRIKQDNYNPWVILFQAIRATRPFIQLKTIRIGKNSVSIPSALTEKQQPTMAMRWLVQEARLRKDKRTMVEKLVAELYDAALYHRGGAIQRRIRLHQLAEKNLGNIRSEFKGKKKM